jgi:hypothetical protein
MLSPTSVTKEHPQPARNPRSSRIPDFWRWQSVLFERFDSREQYGETKVCHEGSVFDVVDVNYTAETKDTQKNERTPSKVYDSNDTNAPPSVDCGVGQYIRMYSHAIVHAPQCIINYYPHRHITGRPVDIFEPYAILVHHWYLLRELHARFSPETGGVAVIDCEVNDTYEHLNYLLD